MTASTSEVICSQINGKGFRARVIALETLFFCLFLLSYYTPLLLSPELLSPADPRVSVLLKELFGLPRTWFEILRNVGGSIICLLGVFILLSKLGRAIARTIHIADCLGQVISLLIGWIFLFSLNALLFPLSNCAYVFSSLRHPAYAYITGLLLLSGVVLTALKNRPVAKRTSLILTSLIAVVSGAAFIPTSNSNSATSIAAPNIIIVGVDSLSFPMFEELHGYLPNLNALLNSGVRYTRAYTPVARTFPAWMTILTGKYAADHGGVFNLRNLNHVDKDDLLSGLLEQHGYKTIYAIDERRFNNMDISFGFDSVIGPKAGALDFLLQGFNDNPIANLLAQTRLARFIIPYSYINTDSYVNYDADGFIDNVLSATASNKPLFLAVHFESAHFPYKTRYGKHEFNSDNSFWNDQATALTAVDNQVGQLMTGLKNRGLLNNALVIVLSDHGESHGEQEGRITVEYLGGAGPLISYGHGTTILSDLQNHIIFNVLVYSKGKEKTSITDNSEQVSLLDIKPLISKFLTTGRPGIEKTGGGCILVETGVRFPGTEDFKTLNEAAVAANLARFYDIGKAGKLQLREENLPQLVAAKDIGWRCLDRITYYDANLKQYYTYKLNNSGTPIQPMQVPSEDKQKIDAYRAHLMASLNSK